MRRQKYGVVQTWRNLVAFLSSLRRLFHQHRWREHATIANRIRHKGQLRFPMDVNYGYTAFWGTLRVGCCCCYATRRDAAHWHRRTCVALFGIASPSAVTVSKGKGVSPSLSTKQFAASRRGVGGLPRYGKLAVGRAHTKRFWRTNPSLTATACRPRSQRPGPKGISIRPDSAMRLGRSPWAHNLPAQDLGPMLQNRAGSCGR